MDEIVGDGRQHSEAVSEGSEDETGHKRLASHVTRRYVTANWRTGFLRTTGSTGAILRSFTASCQRIGIDPFIWLKDVLSRIASHPITRIAELLPHNWAAAQA